MRLQAMPRAEGQPVVEDGRLFARPRRLRLDNKPCDRLKRAFIFRLDAVGFFDRHGVEAGAKLRSHLPGSAIDGEMIDDRFTKRQRILRDIELSTLQNRQFRRHRHDLKPSDEFAKTQGQLSEIGSPSG